MKGAAARHDGALNGILAVLAGIEVGKADSRCHGLMVVGSSVV
jgi:hypothetical protein